MTINLVFWEKEDWPQIFSSVPSHLLSGLMVPRVNPVFVLGYLRDQGERETGAHLLLKAALLEELVNLEAEGGVVGAGNGCGVFHALGLQDPRS